MDGSASERRRQVAVVKSVVKSVVESVTHIPRWTEAPASGGGKLQDNRPESHLLTVEHTSAYVSIRQHTAGQPPGVTPANRKFSSDVSSSSDFTYY